jgi:hypothetical protein
MQPESEYHRKRRMFFVIDDNLVIAPANSKECHFDWLIEQYWPEKKATEFIKTGLRGVVDPDGNIKFFTGENWELNEEIEIKFFMILNELVKKLKINPEAKIGGGAIKQNEGTIWPARKDYGKVMEYIKMKNKK